MCIQQSSCITTAMKGTLPWFFLIVVVAVDCRRNKWQPVYRNEAGSTHPVYHTWTTPPKGSCTLANGCLSRGVNPVAVVGKLPTLLRSPIIDCWTNEGIKKVKLELFNRYGKRVAWFLFNGRGTNRESWFSYNNLIDSSYNDLKPGCTCKKFNFFTLKGDFKGTRHFFINQHYKGCPNDVGWLVIKDNGGHGCPWEKLRKHEKHPLFLYSNKRMMSAYAGGSSRAKVLMISVKY